MDWPFILLPTTVVLGCGRKRPESVCVGFSGYLQYTSPSCHGPFDNLVDENFSSWKVLLLCSQAAISKWSNFWGREPRISWKTWTAKVSRLRSGHHKGEISREPSMPWRMPLCVASFPKDAVAITCRNTIWHASVLHTTADLDVFGVAWRLCKGGDTAREGNRREVAHKATWWRLFCSTCNHYMYVHIYCIKHLFCF